MRSDKGQRVETYIYVPLGIIYLEMYNRVSLFNCFCSLLAEMFNSDEFYCESNGGLEEIA